MPSRRHLRSLFTLCLLCLFSLQALAGSAAHLCRHAPPASPAGLHEHHQHQPGMVMQPVMTHHHHAAPDLLKGCGCGCGCADRHCTAAAPGLSAANPSAGLVVIQGDATVAGIAATPLRDAHDRDLIRPPSYS
ncbi:hypothetical protein [Hydrocarboniphaga sp.]|uniref:hypothetical protein n=1 Tax=Hydrocarboniphaga sp. TaxID=2033016 RepID=UPI003D13278F